MACIISFKPLRGQKGSHAHWALAPSLVVSRRCVAESALREALVVVAAAAAG